MRGAVLKRVSKYIEDKLSSEGTLHFSLIDPDKVGSTEELRSLCRELIRAGTDAFLVGGSLGVSEYLVDEVVKAIKELGPPVILFPGNVTGISRYADAILFMMLMNSDDPYFLVGAQVIAAPIVAKYGLEALPTAYIIVGYGGAAGFIGRARPLPLDKPEIVAAYVLAAEMLGMKYTYLEAGSGAPNPIPPEVIKYVTKVKRNSITIVGGGIRDPSKAKEIARAGADIIVTGTIIERNPQKAIEIIQAIKRR